MLTSGNVCSTSLPYLLAQSERLSYQDEEVALCYVFIMENGDTVTVYKQFVNTFTQYIDNLGQDNYDVPFRLSTQYLVPSEVEGECLEWIRRYLSAHDCPIGLISRLTRAVYTHFEKSVNVEDFYLGSGSKEANKGVNDDDDEVIDGNRKQGSSVDRLHCSRPPPIEANRLLKEVVSQIHITVRSWGTSLPVMRDQTTTLQAYSYAIKNTRRKMEDKHVMIPDFNSLFELKDSPSQSYFAIFDGHCGLEAAEYAATHLHCHLVRDQVFYTDPEVAIKRAYETTDIKFLEKAKRESLRSGTTGVCALLRGSNVYVGWLGDSQAILVRSGQPVNIMNPHKPEREDERKRIEALGGLVMFNGTWRVNGSIAVSRALGDASLKPFISSDADVVRVPLTGDEDYLVLACDGLWDVLNPSEVVNIVYKHSLLPGGVSEAAIGLVKAARDLGSTDNISAIIVLFKSSLPPPQPTNDAGQLFELSLVSDKGLDKLNLVSDKGLDKLNLVSDINLDKLATPATCQYPKSPVLNENIELESKGELSLRK